MKASRQLVLVLTVIFSFVRSSDARSYDPGTGRFVSRDPVQNFKEPNPYAYVKNAAPDFVDPDGRESYATSGPGWSWTYQNGQWTYHNDTQPADPTTVAANQQFDYASDYYFNGANALQYHQEYGPDDPWTKALRREYQSHFDSYRTDIRRAILDYCCKGKQNVLNVDQPANYSLNNLTPAENAEIFFEDGMRYAGLSQGLKRTGSFRATYNIGKIDCKGKCAKVRFQAKDAFRFGSMTRIPGTNIELGADNPVGSYRSRFNTVYLSWYWEETVCLKK